MIKITEKCCKINTQRRDTPPPFPVLSNSFSHKTLLSNYTCTRGKYQAIVKNFRKSKYHLLSRQTEKKKIYIQGFCIKYKSNSTERDQE